MGGEHSRRSPHHHCLTVNDRYASHATGSRRTGLEHFHEGVGGGAQGCSSNERGIDISDSYGSDRDRSCRRSPLDCLVLKSLLLRVLFHVAVISFYRNPDAWSLSSYRIYSPQES